MHIFFTPKTPTSKTRFFDRIAMATTLPSANPRVKSFPPNDRNAGFSSPTPPVDCPATRSMKSTRPSGLFTNSPAQSSTVPTTLSPSFPTSPNTFKSANTMKVMGAAQTLNSSNSDSPGEQLPILKGASPTLGQKTSYRNVDHNDGDTMHQGSASLNYNFEVGLENLGNTCFMNSSLQCLLHIQPLVSYFLEKEIEEEINSASPTKGTLARAFSQLVRDIFNATSHSVVSPIQFKKAVKVYAPHLLDFQQQDCHEFIRFLLDGMSEDLSKKSVKKITDTDNNMTRATDIPTSKTPTIKPVNLLKLPSSENVATLALAPSTSTPPISTSPRHISSDMIAEQYGLRGGGKVDKLKFEIEKSRRIEENNKDEISEAEFNHGTTINDRAERTVVKTRSDKNLNLRSTETITQNGHDTINSTQQQSSLQLHPQSPQSDIVNEKPQASLNIAEIANKAWSCYLNSNDSVVTDLFAGQLQSTIECVKCKNRSWCFDPFLDLSVPIPKATVSSGGGNGGRSGFSLFPRGSNNNSGGGGGVDNSIPKASCTLQECLECFTSEEILDGDDMFVCEFCKVKRKGKKRLCIFKCPKILVVHIKRFRYTSMLREKIATDVNFPISELDLSPYISSDCTNTDGKILYKLVGVSSHSGNMHGGHYIAHVANNSDSTPPSNSSTSSRWICFNDARVSASRPEAFTGPSAYVLFYQKI